MFKGSIEYQTIVKAPRSEVWNFFQDSKALEGLTDFPKVTVLSNGESKAGETVEIQIEAGPLKANWLSAITESKEEEFFVDIGQEMPFPLIKWKHTHSFQALAEGELTGITDHVEFESYVPSVFIKAGLYNMFKDREKALQSQFKDN
ncbi:ligand-binding SRPBCC domain-containing protein [Sinobaca qinghaiensis]|uniref:Ligand-binding SRPBCC domain-containing protein n=1 Tax=Sinobaca qinghaiensis TaxID=342944 RepID=A0A419V689_9BACL|nr:hypothetical protein [Sinobaca qinghaiensis]RKD75480.1 ligand-binding SRPBCC domain-containing protein [Sinobaca qinghaiensis]